jgi:CO dehydrogenase/acetyl-CoA synthase beta subunit
LLCQAFSPTHVGAISDPKSSSLWIDLSQSAGALSYPSL